VAKKKIVSRSTRVDASKKGRKEQAGTDKIYQGTLEAEWTCTSCGREHIPGRNKRCPACSNPRQTGEDYQQPEGPPQYLTDDELAAMGVDPELHLSDETCCYCDAKLNPGSQVCPNCGANLDDTGYTTRLCPACERETNEALCPACGAPTEAKPQRGEQDQTRIRKFRNYGLAALAGIGGLLALCLAGMLFLLIPRAKPAEVSAVSWTRTIEVEQYQYIRREGWTLPPGADPVSSDLRVHHHDQELTGYVTECSWEQQVSGYEQICGSEQVCESYSVYDYTETICYDDGTCDDFDHYRDTTECRDETVCRDEPVYRQVEVCGEVPVFLDVPVEQMFYTYDIWEWVPVNAVVLQGTGTAPAWPELPTGETREARNGRSEECIVGLVTAKGAQVTYKPPCSELWRYEPGTQWMVKTLGGSVTDISPAE